MKLPHNQRNNSGLTFSIERYGSGSFLRDSRQTDTIILSGYFVSDTVITNVWKHSNETHFTGYFIKYRGRLGSRFSFLIGPGVRYGQESFKDSSLLVYKEFNLQLVELLIQTGLAYSKTFGSSWKINLGLTLDLNASMIMYEYDRYGDIVLDPVLLTSTRVLETSDWGDSEAMFKMVAGYRAGLEKLWGTHWGVSFDVLFRNLEQVVLFDFEESEEKFGNPLEKSLEQKVRFPGWGISLGLNYFF